MSLKNHIRWGIEQCHWIAMAYVQDLADADLLLRPVPGMNHIAWQLGHLITGSKKMLGWLAAACVGVAGGLRRGLYQGDGRFGRCGEVCQERRLLGRGGEDQGRGPWRLSTRRRRASWTIPARSRCGTTLPRLRRCPGSPPWVMTGSVMPVSSSPSAASWASALPF